MSEEATTLTTPVLAANGINLFYGNFQALKNISLTVEPRSVTAFIGPSGCGKSTFLRCFNRMNDTIAGVRIEGQILLHGTNVYDKAVRVEALRRHVGMVFQRPNPFPKSIFDNVAYGLRVNGMKDKSAIAARVEESLKQAHLWEEVKNSLSKSATQLSGGQQQRLCIARALAVEPEVLLLDEPASALDPISTEHIEDLVIALKENYTVIIVTHNMQQAQRVSDKTAFFYLGELIEYGNTKELFEQPQEEKTKNYVAGRFG